MECRFGLGHVQPEVDDPKAPRSSCDIEPIDPGTDYVDVGSTIWIRGRKHGAGCGVVDFERSALHVRDESDTCSLPKASCLSEINSRCEVRIDALDRPSVQRAL